MRRGSARLSRSAQFEDEDETRRALTWRPPRSSSYDLRCALQCSPLGLKGVLYVLGPGMTTFFFFYLGLASYFGNAYAWLLPAALVPLQRSPLFRHIVSACCFAAPAPRPAGGLPPATACPLSVCGVGGGPRARPGPRGRPCFFFLCFHLWQRHHLRQDWSARRQARSPSSKSESVRPSVPAQPALFDLECPVERQPKSFGAVPPRGATAPAGPCLAAGCAPFTAPHRNPRCASALS